MATLTYENIALNWSPDSRRDHFFNILAFFILLAFISAGIFASLIIVPKQKHETVTPIPERVAKFISEQPRPKPKPKPKETPKPPPIIPETFLHPKKPVIKKPLTKLEKKARKMIKNTGLLALTKQLSGLMDTSGVDKMVGHRLRGKKNVYKAASVNSKILTADSGVNSATVNSDIHGAGSEQGAILTNDQRKLAMRLLAAHGQIAEASSNNSRNNKGNIRAGNLRSEEDVAYVMDEHKSMLHSLYRRARRVHPGLKGKIVLQITILPSGRVSRVRVVSSELHDPELVHDIVARVRQFDFGAKPVEPLTVTIPVEFLPS